MTKDKKVDEIVDEIIDIISEMIIKYIAEGKKAVTVKETENL